MAGSPAFWTSFREGDPNVLAEVYLKYAPAIERRLRTHPMARGQAPEDLRDLVQETFCRAYAASARRRYDSARPYHPYLLRIGLNLLTDRFRSCCQEAGARRELAAELSEAEQVEPSHDPLLLAGVTEAVAALPPDCREVFEARFVDGLSQRHAARALGISHKSLRTLEKRIKRVLRRRLRLRQKRPTRRRARAAAKSDGRVAALLTAP
jgi:RNA polymerase sigma factor (sigma-70 family)